tara:strand:+ start:193 stop:1425 length:1233 start_codon:yes stop_codon:yes gene_type:complete
MKSKKKISDVKSLKKSIESVSLFDLYKDYWSVDFCNKALERFSSIGKVDESVYQPWPDDPMATFTTDKDEYYVQIPCKIIESCDTYNRTSEISFDSCVKHLEYRGGFNLVGFEAITVFYDRSRGIVRVSRGNHRNLMKLLTDGEYATIPGKLIPHAVTASDEEMLLIEAENFDEDNQFHGMTKTMKYKGELLHEFNKEVNEPWARDLYDFLDSCTPRIGIASTNEEAEVELDSFGAVKQMRKEYGEKFSNQKDPDNFLREILESQAKHVINGNSKVQQLSATLARALAKFRHQFTIEIDRVSDRNHIDAWEQFLEYIFSERKKLLPMMENMTQAELIKGNSMIRLTEYHVATLATLFNEFVTMKQLKHHNGKTSCISTTTKAWEKMLEKVQPHFHAIINQNLSTILSPQA